jgi:hypothetical protein
MATPLPVAKIEAAFDSMINDAGSDCTFELYTGETFTVKGVLRFTPELGLTEGINHDSRKLSVMGKRWANVAPPDRFPEKGDQVTINGCKYAIEEADPAMVSGSMIGWRIKLRG